MFSKMSCYRVERLPLQNGFAGQATRTSEEGIIFPLLRQLFVMCFIFRWEGKPKGGATIVRPLVPFCLSTSSYIKHQNLFSSSSHGNSKFIYRIWHTQIFSKLASYLQTNRTICYSWISCCFCFFGSSFAFVPETKCGNHIRFFLW